ncbi:MAG: hypothetical protein Roseis2KO_22320 [Roseivirga sp.]
MSFYFAPPWADSYYGKVSGHPKNSLIVGSSRAAQGLVPTVINEGLGRDDLYNFAFSNKDSPYGELYLDIIKKKVAENPQNKLFIVEIQPWTLASADHKEREGLESIREKYYALADIRSPNARPNLPYLWNAYNYHYAYMFMRKPKSFLHDDGWLEINTGLDSLSETRALKRKYENSLNEMNRFYSSEFRWNYLSATIDFLKEHGKVYLVRLPVPDLMVNYEDDKWPKLDERIGVMATQLEVDYINLRSLYTQMRFTDLNHLHSSSSKLISEILADSIAKRSGTMQD